jgi:phospholipase/carboxylesterase
MSGRALPSLVSEAAPAEELRDLPVLVTHGTGDEVLRIGEGRKVRDLLQRLPVSVTYREYPAGHQVTPEMLADVAEWLTARLDEDAPGS